MAEFKLKPLSPFHIGQDKVLRGALDLYLEGGILFLIHQEKLIHRFEGHPGAWKAVNEFIEQTLSQPIGEQQFEDPGPRRYERPGRESRDDRGGRGDRGGHGGHGGRGGRDDRGGRGGRDDRSARPAPRGPVLGEILKRFQAKPGEVAVAAYRWPGKEVPHSVLPFLRLGTGKAVLPGSSVKGAIRTALMYALARGADGKYTDAFKSSMAELNHNRAWRAGSLQVARNLEEAVLGGNELLHRLTVRDCDVSFKALGLVETVIQNAVDVPTQEQAAPLAPAEVSIGRSAGDDDGQGRPEPARENRPRWKARDASAPVYLTAARGYTENPAYADSAVYEAIVADADLRLTVVADATPEHGQRAAAEPFLDLLRRPEAFMGALNNYAKRQIELELEFLMKHPSFARLQSFYTNLQRQAEELPPNAALIRLGEGKGWLGVGGAMFDPFLVTDGVGDVPPMSDALSEKGYREFPKTRVIANRRKEMDVPFGWAQISL